MGAIVESIEVRAELTRYEVPAWGVGELWTGGGLVLAHDFDFRADRGGGLAADPERWAASPDSVTPVGPSPPGGPSPLMGAHAPPAGTVRPVASRESNFPVASQRRFEHRPGARVQGTVDAGFVGLLTRFFAGEDVAFDDVPLDLGAFTSFQQAVARELRRIPRGEVVAYGELAALAGYPGAQRAVGTFCARNRFMLLIPCHRVVGAAGIGSYGSSGIAVKRRLLSLEGVEL